MSDGTHDAGRPTDRWASLASFALSTFYVTLVFWLTIWVVVPALLLRWDPLVVTSGSMSPLIRVGDVILVGSADPGTTYDAGTVIAFHDPARGGDVVTHRVAGVNERGDYLTKGDANQSADPLPIPKDEVVGVGRLLVPMIGLPLTWAQNGSQPLFVVWVLATVVACVIASKAPDEPGDDGDTDGTARDVDHRRDPVAVGRPHPGLLWSIAVRQGRRIGRVADHVATAVPVAPNTRAYAPILGTVALTIAVADTALGFMAGTAALFTVLVVDPRGPELRIGRWLALLRRSHRPAPRPRVLRPATAALLAISAAVAIAPRTAAAFTTTTVDPTNSWQAATAMPTPTGLAVATCAMVGGNRHVSLSWNPVGTAASYVVAASTMSGSGYVPQVTTSSTTTTIVVNGLANNVDTYLVVRATTTSGSWASAWSNEVRVKIVGNACTVG